MTLPIIQCNCGLAAIADSAQLPFSMTQLPARNDETLSKNSTMLYCKSRLYAIAAYQLSRYNMAQLLARYVQTRSENLPTLNRWCELSVIIDDNPQLSYNMAVFPAIHF